MLEGLLEVIGFQYLLFMMVGVMAGIFVGGRPGFTATMGIALLLPFTVSLPPGVALGMLAALYVSANFADSVPACLVNTPGTASAVATSFDGFQMTKAGRGQEALVASSFSAFVGALIGGMAFLFLAPPLASIALRFGAPEFFWLSVFALTIIGSIAGDSVLKGISGGLIGLLIGMVGLSSTGDVVRYDFGIPMLRGGIEVISALIGIFAIPQVLEMVEQRHENPTVATFTRRPGVAIGTVRHIVSRPINVIRSAVIGTFVGILPGAGGPVASLVSYNEAARWASTDRIEFGEGTIDGVVASEAAGNGAAAGAMVPLVALGIPGSGPAAVILGALLLQGLRPGPTLFVAQPTLVYGLGWSMVLAGIVTFLAGSLMSGLIARIVTIPVRLLAPIVLFLSAIGAFAIRTLLLDVVLMFALGVVVYLLGKLGVHPGPVGLGVILGPIIEPALVQTLAMSQTSSVLSMLFARPISVIIIVLTVLSVTWAAWANRRGGIELEA